MRPTVTLAALVLLSLAVSTCGGSASGSPDIEAAQSNDRWELRLRIPGVVRSGEMTTVELSLKNLSGETRRVDSDCVSRFGLLVLDSRGEPVFDWYDYVIETEFRGQVPECPPFWKDLAPGETLEQMVSFQVDNPGEYTVRPRPPSETVGSTSQPVFLSMAVKVRAK